MTNDDINRIIDTVEDLGYLVRSYSGRGMYGKSCVAIIIDRNKSEFEAGMEIATALASEECRMDLVDILLSSRIRQDSMGRDSVVYFPNIPWPEGRASHED